MVNKKIKVLHFTQANGGGIDTYLRMYLKYAKVNKFSNVLITTGENKFSNLDGFYHVDIEQTFSPIKLLKYAYNIRKLIKVEMPDIIYLHSTFGGVIGRMANIGLKSKVAYNPHGWSFKMNVSKNKIFIYKLVEKVLSYFTDKFILISKSEYEEAEKIGISPSKLELVYNGIDVENLNTSINNEEVLPKDRYIIGMVGRITEQKNPLFFVEFAKEVVKKYPETLFVIVGDGELRKQVENRIAEYNIANNFLITGWVSEPSNYVRRFNQAVLFSKWEGLSLAAAEYMAMKKPILVSNIGGLVDLIINEESGFIINNLDEAVYFSNLIREYNTICHSLSENAYNRVISDFNVKDKTAEIEQLFINLVK
ncbi:glycosyltransferase [Haemophilus parahaemolyticus]|uniref:glycosyltransferase n=1 Tax=Haemophilus parahaemolyticus TaxID=735 RepID=UPI0028D43A6E|nr:glycosyltransferase [Haemophilus parahaemolyticus]